MTEIGRVRWVLVAGMFLSLGATAWEYPAFAQTSAPAAAGAEPAAAAEAVEPAEPPRASRGCDAPGATTIPPGRTGPGGTRRHGGHEVEVGGDVLWIPRR